MPRVRLTPATAGVLALLAIVVWLVGAPIIGLVVGSITDTAPGTAPRYTFATLAYAYGDFEHLRSLATSLAFAVITATLVLVIGGFLAWLVERTDSRLRGFADLFALAPILMPSVLLVSGWILLLGPKSGMVNLIARDWFGLQQPVLDIYSFWGMVWVGTLQELPLAFLWLWPAFRAMNPDLEEAALIAGADFLTTLRRITLPMLRPTLRRRVDHLLHLLARRALGPAADRVAREDHLLYSTEIYLAYRRVPSDLNIASAYSLMFLAVTVLSIWLYRRATR